MFDYEIKYETGSTNVKADMLPRNPISHYIRPVNLHLNASEIIEMQEKQQDRNAFNKNYKDENGIIIIKKKEFKKALITISKKELLDFINFVQPGIKKN